MKSVYVLGIGTIGEPIANILADMGKELNAAIFFSKKTVNPKDTPKIKILQNKGAFFAVSADQMSEWENIGVSPDVDLKTAESSSIIVDCAEGANDRKVRYANELGNTELFIAQGSEGGFGYPFAMKTVSPKDERFAWVVSCNTHNITSLIFTIATNNGTLPIENLVSGDFTLLRRSSDINQGKVIASPEVDKHKDPVFGTHQAKDASRVFEVGWGCQPLPIFSTTFKTTNQFMHSTRFRMTLGETISQEEVLRRIRANPMMALTKKMSAGTIFSCGRDHGYMGRIMNHSVVPTDAIHAAGNTVIGASFTPQDGNALLSSVYLVLRHLGKLDIMESLTRFPYIFKEI